MFDQLRETGALGVRPAHWPVVGEPGHCDLRPLGRLGRPDLRMHDLRHTFATILFDAGASAPDVQTTLGHSSLQVTERYSRAREGVALRAGAVLDQARGGRQQGA